jgi:beta-galactosidase/beta-glucuronidase
MKAGWGFHVSLEALAKSAYVWQHLRAFRLVRARHAAELGTKNAVNLASLPQEIIDIIEDELALSAYDLITAKEPFHFPCIDCDAFWDELHDSKQHNDALERFQASYIRDNLPKSIDADEALDSDGELYYDLEEQAFEAFSDTTEYDQLCEAFMPIHQFENGCDTYFEKHRAFWEKVVLCISSPDPPKRTKQVNSRYFRWASMSDCLS